MKTINLEQIVFKNHSKMEDFKRDFPKVHQVYITAMKEAVKQALKLAAENADMKSKSGHSGEFHEHWSINKKTILNTINQVV